VLDGKVMSLGNHNNCNHGVMSKTDVIVLRMSLSFISLLLRQIITLL
jgi:hypothetical protein